VQDVIIPALGMAMTEVVLTRWRKQPGEPVAVGDVVADIETDKSDVELESPAAGVLGRHLFGEGANVPVGQAVVRVLGQGENEDRDEVGAPAPEEEPAAEPAVSAGDVPVGVITDGFPAASVPTARTPNRLSPRQRRLAQLNNEATPARATTDATVDRKRAAIARQVEESWRTTPHFSVQREIDATEAVRALATLRGHQPTANYNDLLLRALGQAIHGLLGSEGDLGLAVATTDGVMMPVVAKVPTLDAAGLVRQRQAAVRRGRQGRLSVQDLAGGAVASLSNLGTRGVDSFTGIVPVGQQLLLTVGRLAERAVVLAGGIHVRPTFVATLNVDHRAMDGDRAADVLDALDRELNALDTWVRGGQS
jgi:pyruvate dehydrogenase E2 component (dihydrolipoamide acetyltransferase)